MAVGAVFAGLRYGNSEVTYAAAIALAVGIAIQNFPEGAIISLPLHAEGVSKPKAFILGALSGRYRALSEQYSRYSPQDLLSRPALLPEFRSRCNDICSCRGTYPRDIVRRAVGFGNNCLCSRLYRNDDTRCGSRGETFFVPCVDKHLAL